MGESGYSAGLDPATRRANFDLQRRLTELEGSTWLNPTFANGWVNFGGTDQTVQFRKQGDMVYLRGRMKSGTSGATALTLPAGYRPPKAIRLSAEANGAFAWVQVNTDGTVVPTGSNVSFTVDVAFSVSP